MSQYLERYLQELGVGFDPETPGRIDRAWKEMLSGYSGDPNAAIKMFAYNGTATIKIKGIDFVSLCAHHVLPFSGVVSVEYLPNGKVFGLSKIARVVDILAKRLQLQEELTQQIAQCLLDQGPKWIKVKIKASHQCLACRGAKKIKAKMITVVELPADGKTDRKHCGYFGVPK